MESTQPGPGPSDAGLKVLFAASEAVPLIKTGGLADVAGSLPPALRRLGADVRLILPAYPEAVQAAIPLKPLTTLKVWGSDEPVRILEGRIDEETPLYLVDAPDRFNRHGNPYVDAHGKDWWDNALRFGAFCHAIATLALGRSELQWQPDVVHCNDWQTGLAPALIAQEWNRPATVFTIHNLAYQGLFERRSFNDLHLPNRLWSPFGVEFHHQLSFIKGGLAFADWLTTVSPNYAQEIQEPAHGYGLEGLLQHRSKRLVGVLNGVDYSVWNPAADPHLPAAYDHDRFAQKAQAKVALQQRMGLEEFPKALLFGHISRMVEQKGVDLILANIDRLMEQPDTQLAVLGNGDAELESAMLAAAAKYPGRIAAEVGYDEPLAHLIEGGADAFLMPSRFEPCGLNQIYSLRYGTVPIVRRTGGLADTVVDNSAANQLTGKATGFVFESATPEALWEAMERALNYYRRPGLFWQKLAQAGMTHDFSWEKSARHYLEIYLQALNNPTHNPTA